MDDLAFHQAAGEALIARGLATPEDVAFDRSCLEARLNGLPDPEPPTQVPAGATKLEGKGSTASQLGVGPVTDAQDQPEPVDPLDAEAFAGPASPAAYNFGPAPQGVALSLEQESTFRGIFHAHEIPAEIGNQIGKLWNQAAANPPTEAQLERGRQDASASLHKLWGSDTQKNLAVAQREVQRMAKTNPEIVEMLEVSGLGNSPWLAATLFQLAKVRGRG